MGTQQRDITWVQTQLTVARWHLDAALSATTEGSQHNLDRCCHVCESIVNALSDLHVRAEQREELEGELAAVRSRIEALRELASGPPADTGQSRHMAE